MKEILLTLDCVEKDYNKITLLKEATNNIILEAITKEQKEKGQREINKKEIDPFYQLGKWLKERWNKKIINKKEFEQKKKEYDIFYYLINIGNELSKESDNNINNYIKNVTNTKQVDWISLKNNNQTGSLIQPENSFAYLTFNNKFKVPNLTNGLLIKTDTKELRKNIRNFIVLHEYGHLYEYLKDIILKETAEVKDTFNSNLEDVIDSEGKANAYALDNMYRKDRRNLLKNSDLTKEQINNSLKKVDEYINNNKHGATYNDLYKIGTAKHSKTLNKTLESIEKENKHFNY